MTDAVNSPSFSRELPLSHAAFVRANRSIPGGVNSPARAFGAVGGEPPFMARAEGQFLYDIDGHQYIDYIGSWGPMILGHGRPEVKRAVSEALELGSSFGAPTLREVEIAEAVVAAVPSVEKVRFVSSGTEAAMSAVRVARGVSGRDKIVKMAGHYHGHVDALLVQAGSAATTLGTPNSPGVTAGAAADTILCEFNDLEAVRAILRANPGQVAAVLLEPVAGNMGLVPPRPGYLEGLRELTERDGAILLFDEVMTGFRLAYGGAQERYGVTPDLTALAKILAGGLPGGCVAGRADILAFIEPRPGKPKMKHPGTYNANPLSASAGIATLKRIRAGGVCEAANESARMLRNQINARFNAMGAAWLAYCDFSMVRVLPNYTGPRPLPEMADNEAPVPFGGDVNRLDGPKNAKQVHGLRQAMLLQGIDWWGTAAMTSCVHSTADVSVTSGAMQTAVEWLAAEGLA